MLSVEEAKKLAKRFGALVRERGASYDEETMLAFGEAVQDFTIQSD